MPALAGRNVTARRPSSARPLLSLRTSSNRTPRCDSAVAVDLFSGFAARVVAERCQNAPQWMLSLPLHLTLWRAL